MNQEATLQIFERDIVAICIEAESFPDGVHDAHEKMYAMLPNTKGRSFYGISYQNADHKVVYVAAFNEIFPREAKAFRLPTFVIKKGKYSSVLITDYYTDIPNVGRTFQELLKDPELDPNSYCLEIYPQGHNSRDIQCLVKLIDK